MRYHRLLVLAAFLIRASATLGSVDMPKVAARGDDEHPLWVAASVALTPDGTLKQELFDPVVALRLEAHRSANKDRCISYMTSTPLHLPPTETVDERVRASFTIVAGEVVAAEEGFFFGVPGRLFAISPSSRLKTFGHAKHAPFLFFFIAEADIATLQGHFCSVPGPKAIEPQVGDRVIAFAELPAQDRDREILVLDPRSGLIVQRNDKLLGAKALKGSSPQNLAAVLLAISQSRWLTVEPVRGSR